MRVLIACEYSGRVREAFRKLGHDAWSCDLLESEDNSPYHIQGDVLNVVTEGGVGFDDRSPAVYASSCERSETLRSQDRRRSSASCHRLLHEARKRRHPAHRHREPGLHHVFEVAQAESNCAALDVRPWRNESDLPVAEGASESCTYERGLRSRATRPQDAARAEPLERAEPYLPRYRRCDGRAMGRAC